jgi:hypothetical protein
LQEVVLPVIKINKKRATDTATVRVDILDGPSSIITSGQLAVTLYQREAVTEKMHGAELRAGIYFGNELISDEHLLAFNSTSSNVLDREQKVRFILTSAADRANNKEVELRLEEKIPGSSLYDAHNSRSYTVRRKITSDFDF